MASYHCSVKVGAKGSGGSHSEYLSREGKYQKGSRYEDLEATDYGNMPAWAEHNPAHFWHAADAHERANGAVYREIVVALPRELSPDQRRELVEDFVRQELGERHAYQWAIHCPRAALEGGEQPHAHIMYSERTRDGIDRDPEQYFKRYNAKTPEKGGCRKDSAGTEARLLATRERWANVQNEHLARHGHDARVTHLSLKDQGIDRQPEKHLGPQRVERMGQADISALLERRAAEGELERSQQAVSLIDLSGDIRRAVEADQERQERAERAARAEERAKAESASIEHLGLSAVEERIVKIIGTYAEQVYRKADAQVIQLETDLHAMETKRQRALWEHEGKEPRKPGVLRGLLPGAQNRYQAERQQWQAQRSRIEDDPAEQAAKKRHADLSRVVEGYQGKLNPRAMAWRIGREEALKKHPELAPLEQRRDALKKAQQEERMREVRILQPDRSRGRSR